VRIYGKACYSGSCQSATMCSTDSFTVRPASFTVSSTPASGATQAAGSNYTMSATAVNSAGSTTTNYTGTPSLTTTGMTDWKSVVIAGGSFSGSFTAPRDRLMGRMTLRIINGDPNGATQFNVEEYKRPKFQVTLAAPKEAAKLAGKVQLKGTATAYTGAIVARMAARGAIKATGWLTPEKVITGKLFDRLMGELAAVGIRFTLPDEKAKALC